MYDVILKKVSGGNNVRTDVVIGSCVDYPKIGEEFLMLAESLDRTKDLRIVRTTSVKSITEQDKSLLIETQNSTYKLEINSRA
jgi:hypothetical protein